MKFSHLIQVNDPLNPLIDPLSREQLWRGLVLRAENPLLFVLALDRFEIVERRDNTLSRVLHFGSLSLRDRVRFSPMSQVRYEIEAAGDSPAASLVMTIEEPEPGQLFVRFDYETLRDGAAAPRRPWERSTAVLPSRPTSCPTSTPSAPSAGSRRNRAGPADAGACPAAVRR